MALDQYSIFYIIAFISAGITAVMAFWTLRFRYVPGSSFFSMMLLLVTLWTLAIGIGMGARSIEIANNWIILRMIGVIFSPLAWILFVFDFTRQTRYLNLKTITVLSVIPAVSFLMLVTNSLHNLFIKSITYVTIPPFLIDETWIMGPYFWIHFVYSYLLILVGDYHLLREAYRLSRKFRTQAVALVVATIIPLAVNFSFSFKLIPSLKVNYDPFGLVLSSFIFAWALFNYQLFDLSPIALRVLVDNMVDGMIVVDKKNQVVDINPTAESIFALDKDQAFGKAITDILSPSVEIDKLLGRIQIQHTEFSLGRDKEVEYYDLSISPILQNGDALGHLITIRNITNRKKVEIQLTKLAITDALTGLSNHRHFYELLRTEFNRAIRRRHPLGLIMFDIDHFKKINDQHGHLVGDQILREIAEICQQELRRYDYFCRYGGEEFAVILPETTKQEATRIAERLREIVAEEIFETSGGPINLTISLGVSSLNPANTTEVEQFVHQSDSSLYKSKSEGRNRVTVWGLPDPD